MTESLCARLPQGSVEAGRLVGGGRVYFLPGLGVAALLLEQGRRKHNSAVA